MSNNIIVIIPARGGSKGLPEKNIKIFAGLPLIAWTIKSAINSKIIDKIVVSTDDSNIKEISNCFGAETPFIRPKELSNDNSSSIDVILHALTFFPEYKYVCMLQPTSPLRTTEDINSAFEFLLENNGNCCVSLTASIQNPFWTFKIENNGKLSPVIKQNQIPFRRQDIAKTYYLNGAIYIANIDWLKINKTFLTEETLGFVMPQERSIDIDNMKDFETAELIFKSSLKS